MLDASRIELIDACALQLLAAFVRDAQRYGIELGWNGPSEPFRKAARLLDLEQHLKLAEISDTPAPNNGVASLVPQDLERSPMAQQDRREQTPALETVRMLDLAIAQIEVALGESNDGMAALSRSFAGIASELKAMEQTLWEIPSDQAPVELVDTVESYRQAIAKNVNAAVVGLQFYDNSCNGYPMHETAWLVWRSLWSMSHAHVYPPRGAILCRPCAQSIPCRRRGVCLIP